jgi:hypothetical protein
MKLNQTVTTDCLRVFVSPNGCATIRCPHCDYVKHLKVDNKLLNKPVRIRCICDKSFVQLFDSRSYFRKNVELPGEITNFKGERRAITVTSLSLNGVGFKMGLAKPNMLIDDLVYIKFKLDNKHLTWIDGNIIIRRISGNTIGANFSKLCIHDKKLIGFFLME